MATHHTRHTSNHSKRPLPAHVRPSKPASLSSKRSSSYVANKKVVHKEEEFDDEEVMATSFLQYCTTCEKQIITPSNSVLYCSESCRKKDTEKQFSFPHDYSPPASPFNSFSFDDFRDIVPARSPTQPHSKHSSCASFFEMSSDDTAASSDEKARKDSEASRYLRQFQSTVYSTDPASTIRPRRPQFNRVSTSHTTYSAAPSLTHTPSSSLSYSLPYTPSTRPLPQRTNPYSSSYGSKSIDLVTPWAHAATAPSSPPQYSQKGVTTSGTSTSSAQGEILYEKSPIPSASPANGSLGRLLASPI
ncbi:hypothetical protein K458DRAFT_317811 [Lentithecium fluviatile CBS 122367]|uniref:Life-span regulatory factor-domain-containing protein n=1 Tax=Lentithecium fluviatile CBS 122367 TaxID=1168545 RepID=A0A6G1IK06_9PLEO|nr:hypothetical protein K458DRAFT_317811 [Lentithecium fluviatile CBS 122367]